jgi:hypothetical protein
MVLAATGGRAGNLLDRQFRRKKVRDVLKIPENLRVVVLLAVGYASGKEGFGSKLFRLVRKRKSLDEITSFEEFGKVL